VTLPQLPQLRRVDGYLDAVAARSSDVVDTGPLRAFVSHAPYPYYVRPRPGIALVDPGSVTADHVHDAAGVLAGAGQPVSFEWVDDLAPELGRVLAAEGYAVQRHPLLVRDLTAPATAAPGGGLAVRLLAADAPQLRAALAVQSVGFGVPGTARGEAGAEQRDADVVDDELLSYVRDRIASGSSVVAVAEDADAGVVACGWHQPVGEETEVVGVATLPTHRRRGAAAALVEVLVADAVERGATLALLSADGDAVARIYESVGFVRVGRTGAASPPEEPPG
jgi:GNAT superfamily N-acetyltransferase